MYCTNCGKECNQGEKFCTGCGKQISALNSQPTASTTAPLNDTRKFNIFAIVGFVISIVCFLGGAYTIVLAPLAGLVFSIVALVQIRKKGQKGKGLAIAGIVLGAVSAAVVAITAILSTLFSYAVPGLFRLLLTYLAPELAVMLEECLEANFSEFLYEIFGTYDVNLSNIMQYLLDSMT